MAIAKKTGSLKKEGPARLTPKRRSVKKRVKARYDTHMPDRRRHRVLVWAGFLAVAITIALQLLYPPDRALPLTRIAGQNMWWQGHDQLAKVIDSRFRDTKLKLIVDGDVYSEITLASVGAEPNTEVMIGQVVDYPFWQRFIPLSIFAHANAVTHADVYYTVSVLGKTSGDQAKQLSFPPVNARLAIENGVLVATSEKRGSEVTPELVYEAISKAQPVLGGTTEIVIPAKRESPTRTAKSLESVRAAAEAALKRRVTIEADGHTFAPDNATIASWLQIDTNKAGKTILTVAEDRLFGYFDTIDAEAGVPAGKTNINLTNGHETSRKIGTTGRAIDRGQLKDQIADWLLLGEGQSILTATFRDVAPSIMYDNKYTATEEGLRAYVADAAKRMDVRIAIKQLDGGQWTASARANESIPSASTYKLFVAKWLFDEMDKGHIGWNDPMLDTTVSGCFDRMTIASTNPCAESWLAQAGRANFNQYIWNELGFSKGTNFNMPVATHTTVNDLQKMMLGLNDGSIIGGAHRDRLLHSLSTHPFRYGIAAGSSGQVWDKVGFLWDYVHDTAIVKHPKGTYVMTIMTKGQSYATIASLTREIERIMYP